jgi:hypothetical protein
MEAVALVDHVDERVGDADQVLEPQRLAMHFSAEPGQLVETVSSMK